MSGLDRLLKQLREAIPELRVAADIGEKRKGQSKLAELTPLRTRGLANLLQASLNQLLLQRGTIEHLEQQTKQQLTKNSR